MNRLHELAAEEARLEDRLDDPAALVNDPELAADARLRAELSRLPRARLPDSVQNRVLTMVRMRRRRPWLMAAAAALVLGLSVPVIFDSAPETSGPGAGEVRELQLALSTIAESGQQALALAGGRIGRHLAPAEFGLDRVPLNLFPTPLEKERKDDHEKS